jgi:hypothetical protein
MKEHARSGVSHGGTYGGPWRALVAMTSAVRTDRLFVTEGALLQPAPCIVRQIGAGGTQLAAGAVPARAVHLHHDPQGFTFPETSRGAAVLRQVTRHAMPSRRNMPMTASLVTRPMGMMSIFITIWMMMTAMSANDP